MTRDETRREPLGDISEKIERRREDRSDDLFEQAFEEMGVDSRETETVWERLADDPADASDDASAASPSSDSDRDVRVVDKRAFCQSCRFFSAPPEMSCAHEGTTILELVDTSRVRVANCPIVAETERLSGPTADDGRGKADDSAVGSVVRDATE